MRTYYRFIMSEDWPEVLRLDLRQSDKDELKAITGLEPKEALKASLEASTSTLVLVHDGKVEAVGGVTDSRKGFGIPWFLATDKFSEYRFTFVKAATVVVEAMLEMYHSLFNVVDSRNEDAIKLLRWLGFHVDTEAEFYGDDPEVPLYPFFMTIPSEEVDSLDVRTDHSDCGCFCDCRRDKCLCRCEGDQCGCEGRGSGCERCLCPRHNGNRGEGPSVSETAND